ncbi:uncharacterized protein LOC134753770 [Cydia strobilella]|uniref:uncharacterized protein LOC134753770 n=1 Tax=Cydia strobilella TaxID=1100964 RepID=UPI003007B51E
MAGSASGTGASVLTDIRSMIDLAIGTPEMGVVDFCMLHTVLHCLAQQLNALDKPVELLGGATPQAMPTGREIQTVAITEYIVETAVATALKNRRDSPGALRSPLRWRQQARIAPGSAPSPSSAEWMRVRVVLTRTLRCDIISSVKEAIAFHASSLSSMDLMARQRKVCSYCCLKDGPLGPPCRAFFESMTRRVYRCATLMAHGGFLPLYAAQAGLGPVIASRTLHSITWAPGQNPEGPPVQLVADEADNFRLPTLRNDLPDSCSTVAADRTALDPTRLDQVESAAPNPGYNRCGTFACSRIVQIHYTHGGALGDTRTGAATNCTFGALVSVGPSESSISASDSRGEKNSPPLGKSLLSTFVGEKNSSLPAPLTSSSPTGLKAMPDRPAAPPAGRKTRSKATSEGQEEGLLEEDGGHEEVVNGVEGRQRQGREPRRMTSSEKLSLVTLSKFNLLENVVQDLKDRVYGSMPKNEQILEEVRSQTNMKAITDMWTNLNVSSRLEAAETGLAKLSSLVEDLIKEGGPRPGAISAALETALETSPATGPATATASPTTLATPLTEQLQDGQIGSSGPPYPWDTLAAETAQNRDMMLHQLNRLRADIDLLNKTFYEAMQSLQSKLDLKEQIPLPPPPQPAPIEELLPPRPLPAPLSSPERPPTTTDAHSAPASRGSTGISAALTDRLAQLERRIKECCESMGKDKGTVQDQLSNFQDQLDHLMRQVGALHEDFGVLKLSPNLAKDLEGLLELYQTVQDMQEQLHQVNEVARQLAGEKDDRHQHIKALLEQIEILKTIKMDREDMAEAMAEKADLRMLARKVSHDQFDMACDDLSRGLEHALGKLNTQEALWQQVLDDVQREIESKLDKMELSPLKEFFETKLRLLQDNLKQMASLRRNVEAAGTKRRLLREVNCISCDADAVMPLENTSAVPSKPLPAHLSMKPYLSYELDTIRKTQASNLPQRNLHDWETIEKQKAPKAPVKVRSDTDKHICNRYCGGSHTTTTPAQRVARTGHFIKQWGPDVVPLSSGLAAGDDGRLYKVTTTEHANVGPGGSVDPNCTKKPKSPEPSKTLPKAPVIILNKECRCLDGGA